MAKLVKTRDGNAELELIHAVRNRMKLFGTRDGNYIVRNFQGGQEVEIGKIIKRKIDDRWVAAYLASGKWGSELPTAFDFFDKKESAFGWVQQQHTKGKQNAKS